MRITALGVCTTVCLLLTALTSATAAPATATTRPCRILRRWAIESRTAGGAGITICTTTNISPIPPQPLARRPRGARLRQRSGATAAFGRFDGGATLPALRLKFIPAEARGREKRRRSAGRGCQRQTPTARITIDSARYRMPASAECNCPTKNRRSRAPREIPAI